MDPNRLFFSPKEDREGQKVHEKMLSIANQRNANQNHNEVSLQKDKKQQGLARMEKNGTLVHR